MRAVMSVFSVILVMPVYFNDRSDVSVFRVMQSNDARIFSENSDDMKAVMASSVKAVTRLSVFSDSSDASVFSVDVSVFSEGSNDSFQ